MSTDVTRDFAFGLPKAELHLHLEGTLEPDLKLALARKNGVDIGQSTVEEVQATYQFNDLTSFLAVYYPAMDVLQDEDDFHDLAAAYFERARANGVVRAECFFDPQAPDGTIEAIESVDAPVIGVQWHPEDPAADISQLHALLGHLDARRAPRLERASTTLVA